MNPKKRVFWRKVSYGVAIAVLLALIALVVAGVAILIGSTISGMFSNTATIIDVAGI